ncbi:MAG TPA: hypothetical protein VI757_09120 [Bacteroidia bacterium]|nr:hypothetical protein [Bacteroidia bacterium]
MLIFSLFGMAVLLLFVSEIVEARAIRIGGIISLALGGFLIVRIMYVFMKRGRYRR